MSQLCVCDPQGTARALGPLLAKGGEGAVYPLRERNDILIKWYHPEQLRKRSSILQPKVEAMCGMAAAQKLDSLSWPLFSVYDESGSWIGYTMRRAQGKQLFLLAHAVLYKRHFGQLDRSRIVGYLLDLLARIEQLHRAGIMIGDYNLNNFLADPQSGKVALLDCDSYQVHAGKHRFACPVGSADMTPKEHQNRAFSELVRTEQSEAFSVAIVLFKCLMLGRHPYDIVGGEDPVTNLCRGNFAYGTGNRGIPQGAWYNIWSHMPHRLKQMFITTFTDGADDPQCRPSLSDWQEALQLYGREMAKGWHARDIVPAQPKSSEYRGNRAEP
ncbi:kinase [Marinobacterium aestuarii]|uniref:Kinase n=1 Tax=Marinobacterium aestuarii TaxID=1821621 RepID=A0A1A9EWG3_9GAMM|nr:kinase [Marinobacterium aestuarii]ANG62215.1 kinase [Marinobacterium aestuarii]